MALSKAGLKKALAKYQPLKDAGKTVEEITTELQVDENGYEEDDIKQILEGLGLGEASGDNGQAPPTPPVLGNEGEEIKEENPLAVLDSIDYKNLKGDNFKKYVELVGDRSYSTIDEETGKEIPVVGKLRQDQSFDFQQFRAKPVFKDRFPGMENTPKDFVGIEIVRDAPEHTTRIPVHVALEFNAQILNQHSRAGHGRYYLLKK